MLNVVRIYSFTFLVLSHRHHNSLLHEMSSAHNGVNMKLLEVLQMLYPIVILFNVIPRFEVRIPLTVVDTVTRLPTARALHVPLLLDSVSILRLLVSILVCVDVLFLFMFRKLAPGLLFAPLTATPPHLAAPLRLVDPAGPVKVLFLQKFILTILASFLDTVKFPLPLQKFRDIFLHFISLCGQQLV